MLDCLWDGWMQGPHVCLSVKRATTTTHYDDSTTTITTTTTVLRHHNRHDHKRLLHPGFDLNFCKTLHTLRLTPKPRDCSSYSHSSDSDDSEMTSKLLTPTQVRHFWTHISTMPSRLVDSETTSEKPSEVNGNAKFRRTTHLLEWNPWCARVHFFIPFPQNNPKFRWKSTKKSRKFRN